MGDNTTGLIFSAIVVVLIISYVGIDRYSRWSEKVAVSNTIAACYTAHGEHCDQIK